MGIPLNLKDIQSGFLTATAFNSNNTLIEEALAKALNRTSDANDNAMEVDLDMGLNRIFNVTTDPSNPTDLLTVEAADYRYLNTDGDSLTGDINANGYNITNLGIPSNPNDAARLADVGPDSAATLRTELGSSSSGEGSDLVAMAGASGTVTEAINQNSDDINQRVIYVGSVADLEGMTPETEDAQFIVFGYLQGSNVGGGVFQWDSQLSKANHNGGTIIDPSKTFPDFSAPAQVASWFTADGSGTGCFIKKSSPTLTVAEFGGQDSELLDQSAVLSKALSILGPNQKLDGLGYTMVASEDLATNPLQGLSGENLTILTNNKLSISGGSEEYGSVSAAITEGDLSFEYTGTELSAGDNIAIVDTTLGSFTPLRDTYKKGEFAEVLSVSGATVTLTNQIYFNYPASVDTKVYKINFVDVNLERFNVIHSEPTSEMALEVQFAKGVLDRCKIKGGTGAAIEFSKCKDFDIVVPDAQNRAPDTGLQYGIAFINCENCIIYGGYCFGTRHGVSTGSGNGEPLITNRGIYIKNAVVASTNNWSADFHGNTVDSYYEDCVMTRGVTVGGYNVGVRGGEISSGTLPVNVLNLTETVGGKIEFSDITIRLDSDIAISNYNSSVNFESVRKDAHFQYHDLTILSNDPITQIPFTVYNNSSNSASKAYDFKNIHFNKDPVPASGRFIQLTGGSAFPGIKRLSITGVSPGQFTDWYAGSGDVVTNLTAVELPNLNPTPTNGAIL